MNYVIHLVDRVVCITAVIYFRSCHCCNVCCDVIQWFGISFTREWCPLYSSTPLLNVVGVLIARKCFACILE